MVFKKSQIMQSIKLKINISKTILGIILCSSFTVANAQQKSSSNKRVLFIGNSYTYVNDLPQMVSDVSTSAGDTITYSSSAPGGATFNNHTQNATTTALILQGGWDDVILQEQSQLPSFPIEQVATESFPYARILDSLINEYNPCGETVFYMTWGRKNGDAANCASYPPICTYLGMDSLLQLRYTMMAADNHAILSPVGALWRYLRTNNPTLELYSSDESHPSIAGTYAAACSFYTTIFRKDPILITFNSSLNASDAEIIRNAAKIIVYDSLQHWFIGTYDPSAEFTYQASSLNVDFTNTSAYSDQYEWSFGDGNTSTEANPTHSFALPGSYNVVLIVSKCGLSDTITKQITIIPESLAENAKTNFKIYPNPSNDCIYIKTSREFPFEKYSIVNQYGQQVMTGLLKAENTEQKISLNTITSGVYSIIFSDFATQNCTVRRIVKLD